MKLNVRPASEKPKEKRIIGVLIYEKLLVFGCIEGDIFEGRYKVPVGMRDRVVLRIRTHRIHEGKRLSRCIDKRA